MCDPQPVISLLDMDCFYVQVEARDNPAIAGVPAAVVQYKTWKGGGIIAVNYEARAKGVSRQMRGDDAREKCPDIVLVRVPEVRDKADLTKYRKAGREVIEVLLDSGAVVERASIDEAYLDLTKLVEKKLEEGEVIKPEKLANTHVGGDDGDRGEVVKDWCREVVEEGGDALRLAVGAQIMEEVRAEVFRRTQFRCSAGISHCKTLAKLCAGMNKPNKQTVLPQERINSLYRDLRITKVRGLGGKLGNTVVSTLGVETMGQLAELSLATLSSKLESKTANWLYHLCKGRDGELVKERELPKSIGCGKNFQGKEMLNTKEKVRERLMNLVEELVERVEEDKVDYSRVARGLTVSVGLDGEGHVSRAGQIHSYNVQIIFKEAFTLLSRLNQSPTTSLNWIPPLVNLSICAGKFEEISSLGATKSITAFFSPSSVLSSTQLASALSMGKETRNCCSEETSPKSSIKSFFKAKTLSLSVHEAISDKDIPGDSDTMDRIEDADDISNDNVSLAQEVLISTSMISGVINTSDSVCDEASPKMSKKSFFKTKALALSKLETFEDAPHAVDQTIKDRFVTKDNTVVNKTMDMPIKENTITVTSTSEEVVLHTLDITEQKEEFSVDMEELIPSLSSFSPSMLLLLPPQLRLAAKKRVRQLEENEKDKGQCMMDKFLASGVSTTDSTVQLVQCTECSRRVSPFSLPEHLDWHYALSLSRQTVGGEAGPGVKRKREGGDTPDRNKKRGSDISNFFCKK